MFKILIACKGDYFKPFSSFMMNMVCSWWKSEILYQITRISFSRVLQRLSWTLERGSWTFGSFHLSFHRLLQFWNYWWKFRQVFNPSGFSEVMHGFIDPLRESESSHEPRCEKKYKKVGMSLPLGSRLLYEIVPLEYHVSWWDHMKEAVSGGWNVWEGNLNTSGGW